MSEYNKVTISSKHKMSEDNKTTVIKLRCVRLSFCQALFSAKSFEDSERKFSSTFLLDKKIHAKEIKEVEAAVAKLAKEKFKGKVPGSMSSCLRDGTEKDHLGGYDETMMFIAAHNKKRPVVVDREVNPVAEEDDLIYAGCYVNAAISLWVQDNKWGKRVNAQLRAVQFVKDGEAFGADPIDASEEFEALEEEDDLV